MQFVTNFADCVVCSAVFLSYAGRGIFPVTRFSAVGAQMCFRVQFVFNEFLPFVVLILTLDVICIL